MKTTYTMSFDLPNDTALVDQASKYKEAYCVLSHLQNLFTQKLSQTDLPEQTRMTYEYVSEMFQEYLTAYEVKI